MVCDMARDDVSQRADGNRAVTGDAAAQPGISREAESSKQ